MVTRLFSELCTWTFSSCMQPSATNIDIVTMLLVRRSMFLHCQVLPHGVSCVVAAKRTGRGRRRRP